MSALARLVGIVRDLAAAPAYMDPDAPTSFVRGPLFDADPQENARRFPDLYGDWVYQPGPSVPAPEREATMCDPSTPLLSR